MKTEEFIHAVNIFAPRNLEEEWDNGGWQINLGNEEVNRVLISLEITNKVIDEAISEKVDFILTHHPLIFNSIRVVDRGHYAGNYIIRLIKAGISVYSCHTSFDSAFGGINDDLAERIGLYKVRRLHTHKPSGEIEDIIGRLGEYDSHKTLDEICAILKESLNIDKKLFVIGEPDTKIKKVAVCGGSGGDLITDVIDHCDLLITGDVKYHQGQIASEGGLCVIDAGHYDTEKFFSENMSEKLKDQVDDKLELIESEINVAAFKLV
jgi:dinuclear metal center YbgI/SA1388 family protein